MIFQNHLYGCFIVMEDISQGVLDLTDNYLSGNSLYLNLDTQFSQIGIRYYGFLLDGKAVYDGSDSYKAAWLDVFRSCKENGLVDRIEDEVIRLLEALDVDNYFMNAMEHDGNLTPDWIEKALYTLHPHLEGACKAPQGGKKSRCLSMTRRQPRVSSRTQWGMTRRQPYSKRTSG